MLLRCAPRCAEFDPRRPRLPPGAPKQRNFRPTPMPPSSPSAQSSTAARKRIQQTLDQLCATTGAKNATCLIYNPYSGLYWLFEKGGAFDYPYQICGPLIHTRRAGRFQDAGRHLSAADGMHIELFTGSHFNPMKKGIFTERPFVLREGIQSTLRVTLSKPRTEAGTSAIPASGVHVFVNFRTEIGPDREKTLVENVRDLLRPVAVSMLAVAGRPYLDDHTAWVLRSRSLGLRNRIEGLNLRRTPVSTETAAVTEPANLKAKEANLFQWIAKTIAQDLVALEDRQAYLISCTICRASPNKGDPMEFVGKWFNPGVRAVEKPPKDRGVVHSVARTGQLFYIRDTLGYKIEWERRTANWKAQLAEHPQNAVLLHPDTTPMPEYVVCHQETRAELAIPLVAQGKVVGAINLEASHPNAFTDRHVLTLYQFGSSVALVMRLITLLKDTTLIARLHASINQASDRAHVLDALLQACDELGHGEPLLWDEHNDRWLRNKWKVNDARRHGEGFTRWVATEREPLAVVDIRRNESGATDFKVYRRNHETGAFFLEVDQRAEVGIGDVSSDVKHIVANSDTPVVTGIGFPLIVSPTGDAEAVLWLNCYSDYTNVLEDHVWCLSLLCESAAARLREIAQTQRVMSRLESVVAGIVDFHFGPRAREITAYLNKTNASLRAVPLNCVAVLNVDIRGSSTLVEAISREGAAESAAYAQFLRDYFEEARRQVHRFDGVFDKTMGDGFMALFNVYQEPLFPKLERLATESDALIGALRCFDEVVKSYNKLWAERFTAWNVSVPLSFHLGGGLASGTAFVGGFSSPENLPGFEFSAHGEPANAAAKIQDKARAAKLRDVIVFNNTRARRMMVQALTLTGNGRVATDQEFQSILRFLDTPFRSFCLVTTSVARAVCRTKDHNLGDPFLVPVTRDTDETERVKMAVLFLPREAS
jgi:class 3 adenylate cyclase/GAF domain-containing protein